MSYRFDFLDIECNNAQQFNDRPMLLVDGSVFWGPATMRTHDCERIQQTRYFDSSITIELREDDPGRGRDDNLGRWVYTARDAEADLHEAQGKMEVFQFSHQFHSHSIEGDATYHLTYNVHRA